MISSRQDRELVERFIGRVGLFKDIPEPQRVRLINDFTIAHAVRNEVIIPQEDTSTELYLILKGRVKVTLMSEEGGEYILTDLYPGDSFGEMSLIDGKPRCATVIAVEDSTFGVLRREDLISAIKRDPSIALELLATLVRKLRKATEREESLAFLDVRERLLKLFRQLALEESRLDADGYYSLEKRTQKELALRIGASREATSQMMRTLAAERLIIEKDSFFLVSSRVVSDQSA